MEKAKYVCIFESSKSCPAKTAYKLSPESLAQFCKVCLDKEKWDSITKAMEMIAGMQKNAPSKEFDLEKLKIEREIEMRKLDIEEKRVGLDKVLDGGSSGEILKRFSEEAKKRKRDPRDVLKEVEAFEVVIKERKKQLQAEIKSEEEQKNRIPDGVA